MPAVLLVGEDEMLLHTRAAVLRMTGAEILRSGAASALDMQADRVCDVVVLCHSLREELWVRLAKEIRSGWPKTRILLVSADSVSEQAATSPGLDAVSPSDPDRLVKRTAELLGRSG